MTIIIIIIIIIVLSFFLNIFLTNLAGWNLTSFHCREKQEF